MKKKVILTLCLSLLLLTSCGKVPKLKDGEELFLSVNDKNISATDFYSELKDKVGKDVLIELVDSIILEDKYPADDDLNNTVQGQIDAYIEQYKGREGFEKALEQAGLTEDELISQITLDYRRNKAVEDYAKSLVKDDEIKKYYEDKIDGDIKASHILIKAETTENMRAEDKTKADTKAKDKINEVLKKYKDGAKFEDLAKEYGTDGTKDTGGDLGWFSLGAMDPAFEKAAFALKKGEYTKEPVKSSFGYHIILKTDEKEKPKLDTVKDKIIDTLTNEKLTSDSTMSLVALEKLREKAGLEIHDDKVKKDYKNYLELLKEQAKNQSQYQQ